MNRIHSTSSINKFITVSLSFTVLHHDRNKGIVSQFTQLYLAPDIYVSSIQTTPYREQVASNPLGKGHATPLSAALMPRIGRDAFFLS